MMRPDEQDVGAAVVVEPPHERRGRPLVERQVQHDRQHGRAREAGLLQLLAVELAVAERQLRARREGGELAAPVVAQAREVRVEAEEEVRGRDVVVDDHQPVGGVVDQAAGGAADREVEDADGVGRRDLPVLEERARQVRDPRVHQLREDVRLVARGAQLALDRERLVADRVAVGERSEELVDLHRPGSRGRSARRAPGGLTLPQHVLERLRAPRQRLDASRELQVAVLELLRARGSAGSARAPGCAAGGP